MTDTQDLERRLARWLHAAAPTPPPGMTDRLLSRTAATPQRRSWLATFSLAPALAAAAVVVVAVVIGLQLGRLTPFGPISGGGPSGSSTPLVGGPSPTATATPSATDGARDLRCTNEVDGYAVDYPVDWYANEAVDAPEGLDDVPACRYFAEDEFEIRPNSGLPSSVAIGFQVVDVVHAPTGTVVSSNEISVDGHAAVVREVETGDGMFMPPGTLVYECFVAFEDGSFLHISTDTTRDGDYAAHKAVLDRMLASLDLMP